MPVTGGLLPPPSLIQSFTPQANPFPVYFTQLVLGTNHCHGLQGHSTELDVALDLRGPVIQSRELDWSPVPGQRSRQMNQHTRLLQRVTPPPAQQSGLMQGRARVSAGEAGLSLGGHQLRGGGHRVSHSVRRRRAGALETASSAAGPALGRGRAEVWG